MADSKISQLTSGAPAQAGDEYVVARSGANYKLTLTNIAGNMPATTISSGNLTFSSTAQRITGDMSNATIGNRLAVQNSVTNGNTVFGLLPNGTATTSAVQINNNSDTTAALGFGNLQVSTTEFQIAAGIRNAGTYLPMTFYTGGSERMRLDTSGNLGIGTSSPVKKLTVVGDIGINYNAAICFTDGGAATFTADKAIYNYYDGTFDRLQIQPSGASNGIITFNAGSAAATRTERMRIDSSGNVGIGGTANAYAKVEALGTYPTSGSYTRVFRASGTIPSGTTAGTLSYNTFQSVVSTQAAAFTCPEVIHFQADNVTLGASSAVTNQFGFRAEALTSATNNFGFYSNIASGSNRWNFYAAGTADNYFAGNVGIGGSPSTLLHVIGSNGAPSATANNQFFTIESNTSVQLAFGGEASGVNNAWIQTKQSNNSGSVFTININPLGGSVAVGKAIATNATTGFLYVPTCAGTPTGTPTTITGTAPIVVDTTNNKLYFYSGGAWRDAGP